MKFKSLSRLWIVLDLSLFCYTYTTASLPDIEDQQFIQDCVSNHNSFRSQVSPSASNMRHMTWDVALAKTAKAWAKKCIFDHNTYLKIQGKTHPNFTAVGENIWTGSVILFSVENAVRGWYNEVKDYNYAENMCSKVCGHYTQVVWATSYKVGCAVHFCPKVLGFGGLSNGAHFICNYGPAGNYPMKPYKAGRPCSECNGENCVDNLCEAPKRDQFMGPSNWSPDWDTDGPLSPPSTLLSSWLCLLPFFLVLVLGRLMLFYALYKE